MVSTKIKCIHQNHSRKATLCTLKPPKYGQGLAGFKYFLLFFIRLRYKNTSLHEKRVHAHMPLRIALNSLLPGSTLDWASRASTKKLHRLCLISGFLGPPSQIVIATRITHHSIYFIINMSYLQIYRSHK